MVKVQKGPSILSTVSPLGFLIANEGQKILHSCSTVPTIVPGGAETSILYTKKIELEDNHLNSLKLSAIVQVFIT